MKKGTTEFIILLIQSIALILNLVIGFVEHDVFYIVIAIMFAIFITGDFIQHTIEAKLS